MARLLEIHPINPQKRLITTVVESLRKSGVIVYPTDTTYGLGADLFDKKAIEKIISIKPEKKRAFLTFICTDISDLSKYAHISDGAYRIIRRLAPGPYTFVLPSSHETPRPVLEEKRRNVGIRIPNHPVCRALIEELGNPLISSTAVTRQGLYLPDPADIDKSLGHVLDYIIDGGIIPDTPSTIIDLSGDVPGIIRRGKGIEALDGIF